MSGEYDKTGCIDVEYSEGSCRFDIGGYVHSEDDCIVYHSDGYDVGVGA